jgi:dipeptidyl aminopeptidase/acylaminoacyl peptidase
MAAGCAGDTTAPMSANRPELVFAEVDTGTFTTRLMGYSASQGIWELAPGEANLPEPTQYWWLRPTTGQVLYSNVLADLAQGTYTSVNSPTLDSMGPAVEWAPTGDRLLVELLDDHNEYGLLDARTWKLTGFTLPRRSDCGRPKFTPDGRAVTQACPPDATTGSTADVFSWPVTGGDPTNLTKSPMLDERGWRYSPDMQRVVFYREGRLLVANADGSGQRLAYESPSGTLAAWSPDGQRVAARAEVSGVVGIAILPLDGTARLVTPPKASGQGTNSLWWSPDGARLAYDAFDEAGDGELSLFVINTDGTGLRRLNQAGTFANIAAWYPLSAP